MGYKLFKKERQYDLIDDGMYKGKVTEVNENPTDTYGPTWNLCFEILQGPFTGKQVWWKVSAIWSEGNKLDLGIRALGIVRQINESVDSDELVGKVAQIFVKNLPGKPRTAGAPAPIFSHVKDVLAAPREVETPVLPQAQPASGPVTSISGADKPPQGKEKIPW